ncbi:hypothetical protein PISMIDRAFT_690497 [Pisolithus microcarpus 441]|uniref:DUF6593 domain-containing protein n=1 Tax=Pisolithus microcarpus 441 TaxID=765257 RepID=A0A0C9YTH6_9AGAM|nr:hypothetical protein BKA83DRAFT_690497 [Pisolithus microcarpus]KIK11198.1 hypothetical protein PISMIDRAFT_690497 [Pisolithus microcarpus 441]
MRLSFSSNEYLNTVIHDEDGRQLYSLSSLGLLRSKATVTKHGPQGDDDVIGIITWHLFRDAKIWLKATGSLLKLKWFSFSRTFTGPGGKVYSWNLGTTNCRLEAKGSGVEVAKYHQRNLGIMSPPHAPYLEISPSVSHMLGCIVITFVYAVKLSVPGAAA